MTQSITHKVQPEEILPNTQDYLSLTIYHSKDEIELTFLQDMAIKNKIGLLNHDENIIGIGKIDSLLRV